MSGQRAINGVLLIDKPPDMTAAGVVKTVKRIYNAKKAGHTGTLDPFATGLMICCLGKATRLSRFFLHGDKTYEAVIELGRETDTQDRTGTVINERDYTGVTEAMIRSAVQQFVGDIDQTPPVYSALKHNGTPLYKLARKGTPVQKQARRITFYRIDVLCIRIPEVTIRATCSGGAYIRTLASDIGNRLGCGGHLKDLRRTESCGFSIEEAVSADNLNSASGSQELDALLIPAADALRRMPSFVADDLLVEKIRCGVPIVEKDVPADIQLQTDSQYIKVVDSYNHLAAVIQPGPANKPYEYCCVFLEAER